MKCSVCFGNYLLSIIFIVYLALWLVLNTYFPQDSDYFNYFTDTYGILAAIGGVFGYLASRKWGGLKSFMGRSLAFFSVGLFLQFLGQISYAVYFYVFKIENAYPSLGDFFYFGGIPFYILALFQLFKVLQLKFGFQNKSKFLISVLIPLGFILVSYFVFLKDYEFSFDSITSIMAMLLDFGYPLGEATFLALTIIAFLFSSSTLGGKLKKNIIFLFVALVIQYVADTLYLFHTMNDTWRPGGPDDLFYIIAYVAMGYTLLSFGSAAERFMATGLNNKNG